MLRRRLQPMLVAAVLSCLGLIVPLLPGVGMSWQDFLPLFLFFAALTWSAFEVYGLPPDDRQLRAFTRSAVIFFATALCDMAIGAAGPGRHIVLRALTFSPLPISQGVVLLWQRSRLSASRARDVVFLAHSKT